MRDRRDSGAAQTPTSAPTGDDLVDFLLARLGEELSLLWERDEEPGAVPRPSLPAQLAVVDELLVTLRAGLLPSRRELWMLLYGYGSHPDYDPVWTTRLSRRERS